MESMNYRPAIQSINWVAWVDGYGCMVKDHWFAHIVNEPVSNKRSVDLFHQTKSVQTSHNTANQTRIRHNHNLV